MNEIHWPKSLHDLTIYMNTFPNVLKVQNYCENILIFNNVWSTFSDIWNVFLKQKSKDVFCNFANQLPDSECNYWGSNCDSRVTISWERTIGQEQRTLKSNVKLYFGDARIDLMGKVSNISIGNNVKKVVCLFLGLPDFRTHLFYFQIVPHYLETLLILFFS